MERKKYPPIIYKYRTWTNKNHKKILTENQLYLASPKDFNDPLDCRIGNDFYLLDTEEKIIEYADELVERHKSIIESYSLKPENEKERIIHSLQNNMEMVQKSDNEFEFSMQDKHFGVLSLSARYDSVLMWSHYADYHKGFCIGFFEEKMRKSQLFGKGGPVIYDSEFPKIDPRNYERRKKSFLQTHTKAEGWSYEKEYRLTKLLFPNVPELKDRIITFPDNFISEIILGLKMSKEHKKEIIEIANLKRIKVFEMEQVHGQFKIFKKPVANNMYN